MTSVAATAAYAVRDAPTAVVVEPSPAGSHHGAPVVSAQGARLAHAASTGPLLSHGYDRPEPVAPRMREHPTPSSVASSGVLGRGRPYDSRQLSQPEAQLDPRPPGLFNTIPDVLDPATSPEGPDAPPLPSASGNVSSRATTQSDRQGPASAKLNNQYGMDPSSEAHDPIPSAAGTTVTAPALRNATSDHTDGYVAPHSSFYGLDNAHSYTVPSGSAPAMSSVSREGSLPGGRETPSTTSHHNKSSGSGSYSSDTHPPHRTRYSHAPYAASRSASLSGFGSGETEGSLPPPPPAQLLDQSHLQVGHLASLLSHDKTLELYRQNAKKTNDPDIRYEFATFTMEVVADLEQSTLMERVNRGDDVSPSRQEVEAKQKQQALVAESISLLHRLATRGHVPSCYFLADCYTQGIGTVKGKRDYDKAFPLFHTAGKHGHAAGSYRTAQCLEYGWGTRKDWAKAVSFYRRAAVLSHTGAMHRLGLAELNGELGLSKRTKDGVQWLTRAAELADQVDPPQPQSLHELAVLHEKGIENVIFQDEDYAAELLARAAELQYAPSAYKLGECYEYGKMGCPQDAALSIHYYNIAAQQGHAAACFALTAWYLVGSPGILPQSDTEAYLWAKKAAEQNLAKAEYAVGYFCEVGIGTYRDEREALEWFRRAASHGDKRAIDRLRMSGLPLPPVVHPDATSRLQRRSPHELEQSIGPGQRPGPPSAQAPLSGLHLPAKTRRLSSSRLLRKENPTAGSTAHGGLASRKKSAQNLSGNPSVLVDGPHGAVGGGPLGVDKKGKGREKTLAELPSEPAVQGMPPMTRQRSYSQPVNLQQPLRPLDYNLRPLPAGAGAPAPVGSGIYAPLAHDGATELQAPFSGEYDGVGSPTKARHAPTHVKQVRMPARQAPTDSPQLGSDEVERKKQEREKVLQRRKNSGEDKDCVVM